MGEQVKLFIKPIALALLLIPMTACQPDANKIALQIGQPPDSAVKLRSMETRRYDNVDNATALAASTQALQDLGFVISESSLEVGVLVGSKNRDAVEAGEVAAQVALTIALAMLGSYHNPTWDEKQTIHVTLVAIPVENSKQMDIRANFARKVVRSDGTARVELILEPEIYQQFFEKISTSVFLEGHEI